MTEKKKKGFFKGVRSELKKVHWPTKKETIQYTVIVLIIASIVAVFSWILDIIFGWLVALVA